MTAVSHPLPALCSSVDGRCLDASSRESGIGDDEADDDEAQKSSLSTPLIVVGLVVVLVQI